MIEAIRAYIKTIAEFLFFVMVIRLVSTEKSRKYINFASGIILLLISFGPVIDIISQGETYAGDFVNSSLPSYGTTEQYSENEAFDMVFQNELEQSVKEYVESLGFECLEAKVEIGDDFYSTGSIKSIEITVKNGEGADAADSYLKRRYGAERVEIIYK